MRREIMRQHAFVLAALLALACPPAHAAGRVIFKCTLPDGKTTFSDTPCTTSSSQQELQLRAGAAQPAPARAEQPVPPPAATPARRPPSAAADSKDCGTWAPPEDDVVVEQPLQIDPGQLPHDQSGKPVEIFVSKRGPLTVAAGCSAMVSACSHKSDDPRKSIDACFKSAPRCATERPWEEQRACCPQSCWQKYADLRHQCVDASNASYKALFEEHCVAGNAKIAQESRSP